MDLFIALTLAAQENETINDESLAASLQNLFLEDESENHPNNPQQQSTNEQLVNALLESSAGSDDVCNTINNLLSNQSNFSLISDDDGKNVEHSESFSTSNENEIINDDIDDKSKKNEIICIICSLDATNMVAPCCGTHTHRVCWENWMQSSSNRKRACAYCRTTEQDRQEKEFLLFN